MEQLLEIMIHAALDGGREIMDVYGREFSVELKEDKSPLTEADRRSHDVIVGILGREAPEIPLLSEEGAHAPYAIRAAWDRYFLIDPLDGTKEFIKRNGEFTVNVALVERVSGPDTGIKMVGTEELPIWAPVAGVVYAPVLRELFVGDADGARMWSDIFPPAFPSDSEARMISAGVRTAGRPYTIVASRSHMTPETEAYIELRRAEHPDLALINAGSSLKLCRVADGSADEYPRFAPTMEWDTGAGDAVARAAGCGVRVWNAQTGAADGPLLYNKEDLHNPWYLITRRAVT